VYYKKDNPYHNERMNAGTAR